ncbi:CS1 type fimbrial major subunit [Pseudomonas paraversuta]|uniref:CS1 type fimbrial major subunit n=1 Tax=Pseudomonas paraversuta TaxID=2750624 RepID=UPI0013786E97|nr:CS1 type fimbrial major subunit [Pseudomonas paraversuta]NBF14551.1 adhesin [Pseudomonas sp. Fl4BN2]
MMKIRSLFAATLLASSSAAFAAAVPFDLNVKAIVPSATGLAVWDNTGWSTSDLNMAYDHNVKDFKTVGGPLNIKGGTTAVKSYLVFEPKLLDASEVIDMEVKVGGVALKVGSAAAVDVATAAEATAGAIKEVQISAIEPATGYKEGSYAGAVHMMFESAPAAP